MAWKMINSDCKIAANIRKEDDVNYKTSAI